MQRLTRFSLAAAAALGAACASQQDRALHPATSHPATSAEMPTASSEQAPSTQQQQVPATSGEPTREAAERDQAAPGEHLSPDAGASPAAGAADHETAGDRIAYERAKPVFDAHCGRCHTQGGKGAASNALRHFSMDEYPFAGHHAHEIADTVRKVLGAGGKKPTMPLDKPGAVQGADLRLILDWADAYDRAHPRTLGSPGHHH